MPTFGFRFGQMLISIPRSGLSCFGCTRHDGIDNHPVATLLEMRLANASKDPICELNLFQLWEFTRETAYQPYDEGPNGTRPKALAKYPPHLMYCSRRVDLNVGSMSSPFVMVASP
jgi:hypothetical protein